jgi:hypothetical protein
VGGLVVSRGGASQTPLAKRTPLRHLPPAMAALPKCRHEQPNLQGGPIPSRAALLLSRGEMSDDDPITFLLIIGAGLFVLAFSLGFAAGYITRSAQSHRRRRAAATQKGW